MIPHCPGVFSRPQGRKFIWYMFYVLLTMFAGVGAGWLLRKWRPLRFSGKAVTLVIWLMLFLLGLEVGSNRDLAGGLSSLGLQALLFAAAGICGSVLASVILYRLVFRKGRSGSAGAGEEGRR